MKRQGTGNREQGTEGRDQGSGTRDQQAERLSALLRNAVSPVDETAQERDLWPQMQARLRLQDDTPSRLKTVPWFDWALAGGVALFAVVAPASIPVLLYYL